jgi:cysteine-rich repeat protein
LAQCGDGTLNVTAGEQCDDGNRNAFDGCTNDCTVCSDGVVTAPEECDDGNTSSGDNCDAQCRLPRVVGTGTPESCTEAAFEAALAERSVIFNCGPEPVTITITSTREKAIAAGTTIDGGGRITLSGGGVVDIFTVTSGAALEVRNLAIADGRGWGSGGTIVNNGGTLSVANSAFLGNNTAIGNGGGTLSVANSTFSGNNTAIGNGFGTLNVTNSTFSGNSARYEGALFNWGGTAKLTNCTLSENGSAIHNRCVSSAVPNVPGGGCSYGSVTLTNTIIAETAGPSCVGGPITDSGHNLQFPGLSCGATIESLDPLLDPAGLRDNGGPIETIALLPGSPAINAGDMAVCVNQPVNHVDQRGYERPGRGHARCSIGAYEADAFSPQACTGDCNGTGSVTIDELITLVNSALGNAQASACPHGVPSGAEVNVALIIQAVNVALTGCAT